jgi:hypothetical protein
MLKNSVWSPWTAWSRQIDDRNAARLRDRLQDLGHVFVLRG